MKFILCVFLFKLVGTPFFTQYHIRQKSVSKNFYVQNRQKEPDQKILSRQTVVTVFKTRLMQDMGPNHCIKNS